MTTIRQRIVLLLCCVAVFLSSPVSAQYFGQNKVHYQSFDFKVLKTEHFDIYFYPREQEGAELAARLAERWYERLRQLLRHELRGRQPLILYASHVDFEQTNVVGGVLGEGTGGVTEALQRRIVLPLAGPLAAGLARAVDGDRLAREDPSRVLLDEPRGALLAGESRDPLARRGENAGPLRRVVRVARADL